MDLTDLSCRAQAMGILEAEHYADRATRGKVYHANVIWHDSAYVCAFVDRSHGYVAVKISQEPLDDETLSWLQTLSPKRLNLHASDGVELRGGAFHMLKMQGEELAPPTDDDLMRILAEYGTEAKPSPPS